MNTPYSYTTKEQRIQLKAMPDMTGGRFNRLFDLYTRRLISGLSDEHELDNLKLQLSEQFVSTITYMNCRKAVKTGWKHQASKNGGDYWNNGDYWNYTPVPFGEQMVDDFVAIMLYVQKAIVKEKKKDEIQAAAKGLIHFLDVKNQFKMIATFQKIGARKVKVVLWRDFDLDANHNTSNYVWSHWEMIEYKEYYTRDEICDACMKIVNYNINWAKKRLASAEIGLKYFEKDQAEDEEKYEV